VSEDKETEDTEVITFSREDALLVENAELKAKYADAAACLIEADIQTLQIELRRLAEALKNAKEETARAIELARNMVKLMADKYGFDSKEFMLDPATCKVVPRKQQVR
jgi:hypothetical protein